MVSALLIAAFAAVPSLSMAVLPLEAKNGVSPDVAELLTANLITRIQETGRFTHIIGTKEIESVVGFEKQKQLLSCESQSCLAELAGALGVDYLLTGSVGKLGATWLLNASLVDTRSATVEGRTSRTIQGAEDALLAAMDGVVADLLKSIIAKGTPKVAATPPPAATPLPAAAPAPKATQAAPAPAAPAPSAAPAPAPSAAPSTAPSASPASPASEAAVASAAEPEKTSVLPKILMGVGGVGVGLGVVAVLGAILGAVVGVGSFGALVAGLAVGKAGAATVLNVGTWGGVGATGVLTVGALLAAVVGAGLLVAGVVMK